MLALNLVLVAVSIAALGWLWNGHPASISWESVLFLAGLAMLGQALFITFANGMKVDCSDVFNVVAFVVLAPRDAVLFLAITTVWGVLYRPRTWHNGLAVAVNVVWYGAAGLLSARTVFDLAGASSVRAAAAAVLAAYLGMLVAEQFWHVAIVVGRVGLAPVRRYVAAWREMFEGVLGDIPVQVLSQAPMSLLGVLAYERASASAALLAVPFLVSWHSARQAARLADAQRQIGIDALTGLSNRGRFFERAAAEIEQARRYGHGLAFIMGDLDYFKRVNDTFGHLTGDEVLLGTARAISSVIDDAVFPVARYGGEEFVIAVPVLDRQGVLTLAERVRASVEIALAEWGTSISLGVAYLQEADRIESLIDRADKALYSAKYAGKNRVHEWPADGAGRPIAARAA